MAYTLTIADLTLRPSRYKEKHRAAGGLWVELISTLNGPENARLLELLRESFRSRTYYPARRDGEPIGDLRLGLPLWSRRDGKTTYHLVLLDREWDEWSEGPSLGTRVQAPADGWLWSTLGKLRELLELLEGRRRLLAGEARAQRGSEIERSWQAHLAIHEIDDVNRVWFG